MEQQNNYYDDKAISQSKIKKFLESRQEYKAIYVDNYKSMSDSENMKFGRFYHDFVYLPDLIPTNYIVIQDSDIVGGMMGTFIEELAKGLTYEEAYTVSGFSQSLSATVKAFEEGKNKDVNQRYYKLLLDSKDKTIVSTFDMSNATKMKDVYLRDNEILKKATQHDWLIFNEQDIFFKSTFSSLDLKMKADRIYIKPDFTRCIIEDLKTTESKNTEDFVKSMKIYGYPVQQSFYKTGVQNWIEKKFNEIIPIENIQFTFIPQRKNYPYEILDFIEVEPSSEYRAYQIWTKALVDLEGCLLFNNWGIDKSEYTGTRKLVKIW